MAAPVDVHLLRRHYDRLGAGQDREAWYEDPAFDDLIGHGEFAEAGRVLEIGPGTGRFARRLLDHELSQTALYVGLELSSTMAAIASRRLAPTGGRGRVCLADATAPWPVATASIDRVVATFVLDLMTVPQAQHVLSEARRCLRPGGLFCAASLSPGLTVRARARALVWRAVHTVAPLRVGGCRPISLSQLFDRHWHCVAIVQRNIKNCAIASIVATPQGRGIISP
jgi:SAM-dependent methyltransferase